MLKISDFFLNIKTDNLLSIGSLEIEKGKMVNLIGNNRSGKSLLFKTIHGEYYNYTGEILLQEKPAIFYKRRKQTVLVEATSHLLLDETVWRNIVLPFPKLSSRLKLKITELCMFAGIDRQLQQKAGMVSYSEQKFIEIIRAVAQLPSIVLIDDMDRFFDPVNLANALKICDFVTNSGSSLIISSQNKIENCDKVLKIQAGTVVEL
ncbi:MAG: ATP-binding cassette domain-containing protein [Candidatus Cloacimonadales bacterium]